MLELLLILKNTEKMKHFESGQQMNVNFSTTFRALHAHHENAV